MDNTTSPPEQSPSFAAKFAAFGREIEEAAAWIEIDRLSIRILKLPPRSTCREIYRRELCELMRRKIERELAA